MNNAQLINQDSGDYEYYTPPEIVDAAREVMGWINLDPASSETANKIVKADSYFEASMEFENWIGWDLPVLVSLKGGLDHQWSGNIWMNHPFQPTSLPCKKGCAKERCKKRGYHTAIKIPGNKEWISHLVSEYKDRRSGRIEQACCITYASTSEGWFIPLLYHKQWFPFKRINYYLPDGTKKKGVTKGSVVTYLGWNTKKFHDVFSEFGVVK